MIRLILVLLAVLIYLIIGIFLQLAEWIIGKFNKPLKDRTSLAMVQWIFRVILKLSGVRVTVRGRENIPTDRPVLYVGNHRSYFDILIGYTQVVGLCGFVAKKEIEKVPLLSLWMKMLYCLFLDRENLKEGLKTILQGIDYIKKGVSIWIFPEGTRNQNQKETELLPFKEGSMKIAEKSGCPIIPVAIHNSYHSEIARCPLIRKANVIITFGEPILIQELDKEQKKFLGAYTRSRIQSMLEGYEREGV